MSERPVKTVVDYRYQSRVGRWMLDCFTPEIAADVVERNDRFIEEALELTQANGYSRERAHALVDYVFNRPVGEPDQEVGGVMVTLAALCNAAGLDMDSAAMREMVRIEAPEIMAKIRAKQKAKPTGYALPVALANGALERREDKTPPQLSEPKTPQGRVTGCPERRKPGGCQLHNLHCGYPACDRIKEEEPKSNLPEETVGLGELRDIGYSVKLPPGYHYGQEAMQNVRLGAKLATDAILSALPVGGGNQEVSSPSRELSRSDVERDGGE